MRRGGKSLAEGTSFTTSGMRTAIGIGCVITIVTLAARRHADKDDGSSKRQLILSIRIKSYQMPATRPNISQSQLEGLKRMDDSALVTRGCCGDDKMVIDSTVPSGMVLVPPGFQEVKLYTPKPIPDSASTLRF